MRIFTLALLLTACGSELSSELPFEPAGPDTAPAPSQPGPYPVGVRTLVIEHPGVLTPGKDGPRRLITEVWYPAVEDARDQPGVTYTIGDLLSPEAIVELGNGALATQLATNAVRDAAPRAEEGPFPVIFFSHGANAIRMQSTFLMVDLASHGYVVIAPDHEGNTMSDLILDGSPDDATFAAFFFLRPDDIQYLMERFRFEPEAWIENMIDFDHVGVLGHSFGALTAIRVLGLSDKIHPVHAMIAQAPPGHGPSWLGIDRPLSELNAPVLIEAGGLDDTTPVEDALTFWDKASNPKMELVLETAGHFTFSDLCTLDPAVVEAVAAAGVGDALEDGCGPENVAPEPAHAVIRHFTIGLFNGALRDSPGSLALLTEAEGKRVSEAAIRFRRAP